VVDSPPVSSHDGCVVGAVRAELEAATAGSERLGLAAAAMAFLDDPKHVATQPAVLLLSSTRQTTQIGPIVDALPDDSIPCYRDAGGRTLLVVTAY